MWSPFCKKRRLTRGFVIKGGTEGWAFWDNENKILNLEMVLGKYNVKGSCSAGVCGAPLCLGFPICQMGLGLLRYIAFVPIRWCIRPSL